MKIIFSKSLSADCKPHYETSSVIVTQNATSILYIQAFIGLVLHLKHIYLIFSAIIYYYTVTVFVNNTPGQILV